MASASITIRLAVALSVLPTLAGAEPALSGAYRSDSLGRVELSTEAGRVLGVTAPGNVCNFDGRQPVLEGSFEEHVLVGTLTVCQTGPSCELERTYPVLAIYSPADGSLAAHVRLQPGCQSPMLGKGGRLVLQPASGAEEPQGAVPAGGSASSVARKREQRTPNSGAVPQWLRQGESLYRRGDYKEAAEHFSAAISLEPHNAVAYHGLGAAQLMQNEPREAIKSLEKALRVGSQRPETAYLLACSYARLGKKPQGKQYLRKAVGLGYRVDAKLLSEDKDLQNLLGSEAELQAFLKQANRKQVESERQDPPEP